MTAQVQSFDGSDSAAAIIAVDALEPETGDFTFSWRVGNKIYVAKYKP